CANSAINDIALTPAVKEMEGRQVTGFNLKVGGALGPAQPRLSVSLDVFLLPEDVVETCLCIVEIFRENGGREKRNTARLKFLIERWGIEGFREELQKRLGKTIERSVAHAGILDHVHLGINPQKQEGLCFAGLYVPVGRLSAIQALELSRLAEDYGSGEIRLTHQQNVIIPNIPMQRLEEFKKEGILKDMPLEPSPLMRNLVACTGNDYCSFALLESKGRAIELVRYLEERFSIEEPLKIHFSGCPNSCGQHQIADIGLQGVMVRVDGRLVDAVNIFIGGRAMKDARPAEKVFEKVPWSEAPEMVGGLIKDYLEDKIGESSSGNTFGLKIH
ncbi:MAG: hypothetical protein V3R93_06850, partial [Candidatus Hydrothermarchaeaceae archaeon]